MPHKLLLADDSATIQRVIELTFAGEEVHVVAVSDGEEAIARIPIERPDIVLADIGMPKRNGYEVSAFVKGRADLSHIPVLLLAGALEPVDQARADEVRCDGVLVKPFEPQRVIARVRELMNGGKGPRAAVTPAPSPPPAPVTMPPAAPPPIARQSASRPVAAPTPEPAPSPAPSPALAPPPADESLGDYFDQLDAAFANLGSTPAPSPVNFSTDVYDLDTDAADLNVPTLDSVLSAPVDLPLNGMSTGYPSAAMPKAPPVEPAETAPTLAPAAPAPPPRTGLADPGTNVVADAFTALLALERGEPGASPVRLVTEPSAPPITDELVDELTRRVLQRLAPGAADDLVAKIVSEIAERLVREEIARIRKMSGNV